MRSQAPTFRRFARAWGAAALAAVLLGPPGAGVAAPARPDDAAAALPPACTPVQPATLTATVTQPKSVWDNVGIAFKGTLPAGTAAGSCVEIPSVPELPLRSFGAYPAFDPGDPAKPHIGTMYVEADGITFTFDSAFLANRRNISFAGNVLAGMNVDTTSAVPPGTITWSLPGVSASAVVQVPPCPDCDQTPEWGYKYAVVDDRSERVLAGVVLGVKDWERIPGDGWTTRITLSDELGPGQECQSVTLHDVTHDAFVGSFPCTSPVSVTFDAFRWSAYKLSVNSRITDRSLASYTDIGRVTVGTTDVATYTATAVWNRGDATVGGDPPTAPGSPPVSPPSTPPPVPDTTQTTTVTPFPLTTPTTPTTPTSTTPTSTTTTTTPTTTTLSPTPTPTPTPTSTTPGVVELPRDAPTVQRTFQLDRLRARTTAQASLVARLDDDRLLRYREDKPLWRLARYQMITLAVPANASTAWLIRALNARTTSAIGDLVTTRPLRAAAPGRSYLLAWELGRGATVRAPWGARNSVPQRFVGRG